MTPEHGESRARGARLRDALRRFGRAYERRPILYGCLVALVLVPAWEHWAPAGTRVNPLVVYCIVTSAITVIIVLRTRTPARAGRVHVRPKTTA